MDLFPDSKDFQTSSHIDLDRDAALWDDYITQNIKKITKEKPVSIVIAWTNKDVKAGYAVGSVIVKSTQSESKFTVPLIIKNFKLAPMDAAQNPTTGKMSVFNEDSVDDLLFDGSLASSAEDRKKQPYEDLMPQSGGMSYTKSASIMSLIADSIDPSDWARVQKEIQRPEVLYKFAGEKSLFVELFKHKLTQKEKPKKEVEVIKKIGPNSYMMMSNSLENFDPAIEIVSNGQVVDFINGNVPNEHRKDFVETMENSGVIIDWSGRQDGVKMVDDSQVSKVVPLDDPGFYRVKAPNAEVDGMFIKAIYEPITDRKSSNPVFISGMGGGPQQGKPTGISVQDVKLPIRNPRVGDYGYFLYVYKDEPVLVGPYTVKTVNVGGDANDYPTPYGADSTEKPMRIERMQVALDNGSQATIRFSQYANGFDVFNPNKSETEGYRREERKEIRDIVQLTMPNKDCAWIPCNDIWEIGKLKEGILKTAGARLRKMDDGGYEFNGIEGLSGEWRYPKDDLDAAFVLRCCGAGMEKIAAIMDKAKRVGVVHMDAKLSKLEKKASVKHDLRFVDKKGLTKLASVFEDMTTVDAVLSLNFITSENIAKFVSSIPQFEKVREELLRLLIVSRLGNIEINENTIKSAIDVMEKVINGLHTLKARI